MKLHADELLCGTCYACRGSAHGKKENYNYSECGLKNVVLKDVIVYRCTRCGSSHVEIPNMIGLHRCIALAVLCKSSTLCSDEIRFLRSVAGFTATELAKNLGITKNAVSRWENKGKIGRQSERSIRVICGLAIIAEIVNDPPVMVDAADLQRTIDILKKFLLQFKARTVLAAVGDEVRDAESLFIDPDFPFNASFLPPCSSESSSAVQ